MRRGSKSDIHVGESGLKREKKSSDTASDA